AGYPFRAALAPTRPARTPSGRNRSGLLRDREHAIVLCLDDARGCRHSRLERAIAIVHRHNDVIGDDVLYGVRRLTHLPHGAVKLPTRKSLYSKRRGITDLDVPNIGFAHVRVYLHLGQVGGDEKQDWRLKA